MAAVAGAARNDVATARSSNSGEYGSAIAALQGASQGSTFNARAEVANLIKDQNLQRVVINVIRDMGIHGHTAGMHTLATDPQNLEVIRIVIIIARAPRDDVPPS